MKLVMITAMGARIVGHGTSAPSLIGLAQQLATLDRAIPAARIIRVRYEIRTADGQLVKVIAA